jgi:hypothetical protein
MTKKSLAIIMLLILFFQFELVAQKRYGLVTRKKVGNNSISFSMGPTYCFSDTQGSIFESSITSGNNYKISLGFKQKLPNNFAINGSLQYGRYIGNDGDYYRKYSYLADIMAVTARGEYSISFNNIRFNRFSRGRYRYAREKPNSVYGFLGGGLASSNILKADLTSVTNAQFKPKSMAFVIPFGVGYQYLFGTNYMIGAELEWQYAVSDYLEGLHPQPPSSKSNDVLGGISITFAYKFL